MKVLKGKPYRFDGPVPIASDGTHVWVGNDRTNSLSELNAKTGAFIRYIQGKNFGLNVMTAIARTATTSGCPVLASPKFVSVGLGLRRGNGSLVVAMTGPGFGLDAPNALIYANGHIWVANTGSGHGDRSSLRWLSRASAHLSSTAVDRRATPGRSASSPDCTTLGWTCQKADLVIGTSAGSTAAAQITSGTSPTELLASILDSQTPPRVPAGADRGRAANTPMADHMERTNAIIASAADAPDMRRRLGAAALELDDSTDDSGQQQWRATVAARLPNAGLAATTAPDRCGGRFQR